MTTGTSELRLAEDIARHHEHLPTDRAADAIASHIERFWEPRMVTALLGAVAAGAVASPLVAAAAGLLRAAGMSHDPELSLIDVTDGTADRARELSDDGEA